MPATGTHSARDPRFDSLRGLMLVCMTVNHLPSILRVATDESLGIFSAAEGFIFLSGLMAGWVYTRRMLASGMAALDRVAGERTKMIYGWHVASFLVALAAVQLCAHLFGVVSTTSPELFYKNPLLAAGLGAVLLYQPGLLDILPLYCVFVLLLPGVIRALESGRRVWVIGASAGLWFAVQWITPIDALQSYPINIGTFNPFAWQFLFVGGIVIGHAKATDPRPLLTWRPGLVLAAFAVAVYGFGVQHLHWRPAWSDATFGVMLNKPSLGGLRLANFAVVSYLVAVVGGRFPRLFNWRPLAFLGQHSISVFAVQSVAVMIMLEFPPLFATPFRNVATTAAAIAVLFAAAALHRKMAPKAAKPPPPALPPVRRRPGMAPFFASASIRKKLRGPSPALELESFHVRPP